MPTKKSLLCLLIVFLMFAFSLVTTAEQEEIMLTINDVEIYVSDFEDYIEREIMRYLNIYGVNFRDVQYAEQLNQLKFMIYNQLIANEVLLQISGELDLNVTDQEVDEEISSYIEMYGDEDFFVELLTDMGYTLDLFKYELMLQMTFIKLGEHLYSSTEISDQELEAYFQQNKDLFELEEEKVEAAHILVDTEAKALELIAKLDEGAEFADLAREYSSCPSGNQGGNLGVFGRGQMVLPFEQAAFAMTVGEISSPVQTDFGWHIIKLLEYFPGDAVEFSEMKEEIKEFYIQDLQFEKAYQYLDQAIQQADLEVFKQPF